MVCRFFPDCNLVASTGRDNSVRLWNIRDKNLVTSLKGRSDDIRVIAFSPNGEYIASGTASGTVELWQLSTEQLVYVFSGHEHVVEAIAFSHIVTSSLQRVET